jgi:wyosine [tRNA(Phe)-imidazoG37] synthetase (radical SAM superfamily)
MKYVFGPVNSRRLGISLGIDIVPFKTCSFDCTYCECGHTTVLTDELKEYVPYNEVINEIEQVLSKKPVLDVVTFSGSGEPTLNSRIGDMIKYIKSNFPQYRVAVLTNSSMLHKEEVRRNIINADIIYPSLDAVSPDIFKKINRPIHGIDPNIIIESLVLLRKEFKGKLSIEIFIINKLIYTDEELAKLKDACIKISPDEIHINSLDRPGAEDWIKPIERENLESIRNFFYPLPVKLIMKREMPDNSNVYFSIYEDSVCDAIIKDRLSAEEIADILNIRLFDALRTIKNLQADGKVKVVLNKGITYYMSNK